MTGSAGAVPSQVEASSRPVAPQSDEYVYIRPSEWASALAHTFDISIDQALSILAEVPTADIRDTGLAALVTLWERSVESCAQYVMDREVAAGMGLGYFRWRRELDGRRTLGGTELASSVGIWQVLRDLAVAAATIDQEALPEEVAGEGDASDGPVY